MKTCFRCNVEKPLSEYYAHKEMADGHLNKCKECTKADVRRDRRESDRARHYDRQRRKTLEYRARQSVYKAKKNGKLIPEPCEECGAGEDIHAHHDDYSKPLEVRWLCPPCHGKWHREHP